MKKPAKTRSGWGLLAALLFVSACSGSDADETDDAPSEEPTTDGEPNPSDDPDTDNVGGAPSEDVDEEGLAMCCELGAICHVVGLSGDPKVAACHELGHRRDPSACRDSYDECREACAGVTDMPQEHACD